MDTPYIETEALLIAMRDAEADTSAYEVDAYLRENFLVNELAALERAAFTLAARARTIRRELETR